MKKRYLLSALTVVTIAALTACSGTSSAAGQTTAVTPKYESAESADISAAQTTTPQAESVSTAAAESAASGSITEDQARAAALADAGVTEDQVSRIRIKTDRDDGRDIYEVEFYVDQSEYDYDIDMATGAKRQPDRFPKTRPSISFCSGYPAPRLPMCGSNRTGTTAVLSMKANYTIIIRNTNLKWMLPPAIYWNGVKNLAAVDDLKPAQAICAGFCLHIGSKAPGPFSGGMIYAHITG